MDAGEKYLSTFVPYGIKGNREFSKMKKMFSKLKGLKYGWLASLKVQKICNQSMEVGI